MNPSVGSISEEHISSFAARVVALSQLVYEENKAGHKFEAFSVHILLIETLNIEKCQESDYVAGRRSRDLQHKIMEDLFRDIPTGLGTFDPLSIIFDGAIRSREKGEEYEHSGCSGRAKVSYRRALALFEFLEVNVNRSIVLSDEILCDIRRNLADLYVLCSPNRTPQSITASDGSTRRTMGTSRKVLKLPSFLSSEDQTALSQTPENCFRSSELKTEAVSLDMLEVKISNLKLEEQERKVKESITASDGSTRRTMGTSHKVLELPSCLSSEDQTALSQTPENFFKSSELKTEAVSLDMLEVKISNLKLEEQERKVKESRKESEEKPAKETQGIKQCGEIPKETRGIKRERGQSEVSSEASGGSRGNKRRIEISWTLKRTMRHVSIRQQRVEKEIRTMIFLVKEHGFLVDNLMEEAYKITISPSLHFIQRVEHFGDSLMTVFQEILRAEKNIHKGVYIDDEKLNFLKRKLGHVLSFWSWYGGSEEQLEHRLFKVDYFRQMNDQFGLEPFDMQMVQEWCMLAEQKANNLPRGNEDGSCRNLCRSKKAEERL